MKIRKSLAAGALALSAIVGGSMVLAGPVDAAAAPNAGQFCKKSDDGLIITADNGATIQCQFVDGYQRWVVK